jgi:hypothetical protein
MSASGPSVEFTEQEQQTFIPLSRKLLKQEITLQGVVDALNRDRAAFDKFISFHEKVCAKVKLAKTNQRIDECDERIESLEQRKIEIRQTIAENEAAIKLRTEHYAKTLALSADSIAIASSSSAQSSSEMDTLSNKISQIDLNRRTNAATAANPLTQPMRHASSPVAPAAPARGASAAAASSNNAALPPRQPATPKLQLPPLPSSSPLKPKAPAVQARAATTSALPSTLAAKAAAAASSSSTSAPTHIVIVTPAPVYLVQAKAPAKPPVSKPNAKQAPMAASRALPPTPCHAAMATASRSVISVPGPERNGARPSK